MTGCVSGVCESPTEGQFLTSPAWLYSFKNCLQPCKAQHWTQDEDPHGESQPTGLALNFHVLKLAVGNTQKEGHGEVGRKQHPPVPHLPEDPALPSWNVPDKIPCVVGPKSHFILMEFSSPTLRDGKFSLMDWPTSFFL